MTGFVGVCLIPRYWYTNTKKTVYTASFLSRPYCQQDRQR